MLKKLFPYLIAFLIGISPILADGKSYRSSYGKSANNSKGSTYKIGNTKHKFNETYKTSGLPKVQRSEAAKRQFLRSKGYKKVPPGYEVDHTIPLSKGGKDQPSNMQLIPKSSHKQKTANERRK